MNDQDIDIAPQEISNGESRRDYRDDLRDLLDKAHNERGLTRYRLCKQMGIDSGTLSNVLAKRRHFSLDKLMSDRILGEFRIISKSHFFHDPRPVRADRFNGERKFFSNFLYRLTCGD